MSKFLGGRVSACRKYRISAEASAAPAPCPRHARARSCAVGAVRRTWLHCATGGANPHLVATHPHLWTAPPDHPPTATGDTTTHVLHRMHAPHDGIPTPRPPSLANLQSGSIAATPTEDFDPFGLSASLTETIPTRSAATSRSNRQARCCCFPPMLAPGP